MNARIIPVLGTSLAALLLMAAVLAARAGDDKPDATLKVLLKDQLATARQLANMPASAFRSGPHGLLDAQVAVLNAELDLSETDGERVAAYERFVAEARKQEQMLADSVKAGVTTPADMLAQRLARLKAEIALERLKKRGAGRPQ